MDLNLTKATIVFSDPSSLNKSRLGIHYSLFPYSQSGLLFSTSVLSIPRKKPAKLDDVQSNGWLDAMKSSLPPIKKILKEVYIDISFDDVKINYPSALNCFQQIMSNVAKYLPIAIISGRSHDKVYDLVGLMELYSAGSHGMDIMLPVENMLSANDSTCIKTTDQQLLLVFVVTLDEDRTFKLSNPLFI